MSFIKHGVNSSTSSIYFLFNLLSHLARYIRYLKILPKVILINKMVNQRQCWKHILPLTLTTQPFWTWCHYCKFKGSLMKILATRPAWWSAHQTPPGGTPLWSTQTPPWGAPRVTASVQIDAGPCLSGEGRSRRWSPPHRR